MKPQKTKTNHNKQQKKTKKDRRPQLTPPHTLREGRLWESETRVATQLTPLQVTLKGMTKTDETAENENKSQETTEETESKNH